MKNQSLVTVFLSHKLTLAVVVCGWTASEQKPCIQPVLIINCDIQKECVHVSNKCMSFPIHVKLVTEIERMYCLQMEYQKKKPADLQKTSTWMFKFQLEVYNHRQCLC